MLHQEGQSYVPEIVKTKFIVRHYDNLPADNLKIPFANARS